MAANTNSETWQYGCEHELADWHQSIPLPYGFKTDERDVTMVNSNGIAVDPKRRLYHNGGEINTPPTGTIEGQCQCLEEIIGLYPDASVNYRSNLHIHIHVPGLAEDLRQLKRLQAYIHEQLPTVLELVEPIPKPTKQEFPIETHYKGAMRRYKRRKVSHHTFLTKERVAKQLTAKSPRQFHEFGVPLDKDKKPQWQCQPREAVSLRQLLQTNTIEFRHFPGTLDKQELLVCLAWCRDFLQMAFAQAELLPLYISHYACARFPQFPPYFHWIECRYRATCHDGSNSKETIKNNIKSILKGTFDEYPRRMPRQRVQKSIS